MGSLSHPNATCKFPDEKLKHFHLCKKKTSRTPNVTFNFVFFTEEASHELSSTLANMNIYEKYQNF